MNRSASMLSFGVLAVLCACSAPQLAGTTVTAQVPTTVFVTASSQDTRMSSVESSRAATSTKEEPTTSSAAADALVPLGSTQSIGKEADVTAYTLDRAVPAPDYDSDRSARTALDVQVCINVPTTGVSSDPWALTDAKGGRYKADIDFDGKLPQYPYSSEKVAVGECIRGWIMMDVPKDAVITGVRYGLEDGTVLRWSVKP